MNDDETDESLTLKAEQNSALTTFLVFLSSFFSKLVHLSRHPTYEQNNTFFSQTHINLII